MQTRLPASLAVLAALLLEPVAAHALAIGQSDAFEDGTTLGWSVPGPSPNPPVQVPGGGPGGGADGYLQLVATGVADAGGRLAVLNSAQWSGDYLAQGIRAIRMDVNNFGPEALALRLLFEDFEGVGPPVNLALSAAAVLVPAGSGWTSVIFPITPDDLVAETFGTVVGALSDTDTLRIFHNPDPTFPGPGVGIPTVTATLGVDNITAVAEPSAATLLFCVLAALLVSAGRRAQRSA